MGTPVCLFAAIQDNEPLNFIDATLPSDYYFDVMKYVPILNARGAEYRALKNLPLELQKKILPLLQIDDIPWNYDDEKPECDIDEHIQKAIGHITGISWPKGHPIMVDLPESLAGERLSGGDAAIVFIAEGLRRDGLVLGPVIDSQKPTEYIEGVKSILKTDGHGICLRLSRGDFGDDAFAATITNLLARVEAKTEETDVIIDFEAILPGQEALLLLALERALDLLVGVGKWKNIIFAASSFPKDLSDFEAGSIEKTPRVEWAIWQLLTKNPKKPKYGGIGYGDYTTSHPEQVKMNPKLMTISASLRYTLQNEWLVLRGRSTKKFGFGQYNELCSALVARKEFYGKGFSGADEIIADRAASKVGTNTGNYGTWRLVAVLHHIIVVLNQL